MDFSKIIPRIQTVAEIPRKKETKRVHFGVKNPPAGEFVEVGTWRIRRILGHPSVRVADRPSVIFIHGYAANAFSFHEMQTALSRQSVTHNLDRPGMGFSDRPNRDYSLEFYAHFIKEYMDQEGIEQCDLVGHSLGGSVILLFSALFPERVRKLVLLSPLINFARLNSGLLGKAITALATPGLAHTLLAFHGRWFVRLFLEKIMVETDLIDKKLVEGYFSPWRIKKTNSGIYRVHKLLKRTDMESLLVQLPRLVAPCLLLWGEEDPLLPFEDAKILKAKIPTLNLHSYPEAGHMLMHERNREVNLRVIQFLYE
jgi:pimeloyl-ACP methyl ester carboxylesterase